MIKQCAYCGKEFDAGQTVRKYCSEQCSYIARLDRKKENYQRRKQGQNWQQSVIKQCPVCNKTFEVSQRQKTRIYCSSECKRKSSENTSTEHSQKKQCKLCGKEFIASNKNQMYCSVSCKSKNAVLKNNGVKKKKGMQQQHCKKHNCLYSPSNWDENGCDYCYLTGEARGCDIKNCTRYVKATQKERDRLRHKVLQRGF